MLLKAKILFLKLRLVFLVCASIFIGGFGYRYYYFYIHDRSGEVVQLRANPQDGNQFINPLILVADSRKIEFEEYQDLKAKVKAYVNSTNRQDESISFYFRDLNSGEWVGVNEDFKYSPSSMLKVATLIAYFKLAESKPAILNENLYYKPTSTEGQYYKPRQMSAGNYTVLKMLQQMIIESDNDALFALNSLYPDKVVAIYKDLKVPDPLSEEQDFMSPRDYSRFYRALYNGAYLSHPYSNEILKLLTLTNFKSGIANSVNGVVVAHKFGELTTLIDGRVKSRELHDCGIVYLPEKPYFICVMTRGDNFDHLQKMISDLSAITFEYLQSKHISKTP